MCLWMTGSVHGLEHKDWSLLPFGGAAEENDYVLPILGKLAGWGWGAGVPCVRQVA